jgi:hypothetical protein
MKIMTQSQDATEITLNPTLPEALAADDASNDSKIYYNAKLDVCDLTQAEFVDKICRSRWWMGDRKVKELEVGGERLCSQPSPSPNRTPWRRGRVSP